jgi:hypothetical protein
MFGTELAYVRACLAPLTRPERDALAKKIRVHERTLRRIVDGGVCRADTTGKLAIYFRTKEKRKAA